MAHTLDIPIRFRFLKVPAMWEIRTVKAQPHHGEQEFAFSKVEADDSLDAFVVSELDGWLCRDEFFDIPAGDNEALLRFLTKVGVWHEMQGELKDHWSKEVMQHYREGNPVPVDVSGLWQFRDRLKHALLDRAEFKKSYAPALPNPKTGLELLEQMRGIEFPLRFELTRVASGVVTITAAFDMLLATVFVDITRGLKFKVCERKDCQGGQRRIFPVESEHERKYCSQYCGHIESVRRNRRKARSEKRKRG